MQSRRHIIVTEVETLHAKTWDNSAGLKQDGAPSYSDGHIAPGGSSWHKVRLEKMMMASIQKSANGEAYANTPSYNLKKKKVIKE